MKDSRYSRSGFLVAVTSVLAACAGNASLPGHSKNISATTARRSTASTVERNAVVGDTSWFASTNSARNAVSVVDVAGGSIFSLALGPSFIRFTDADGTQSVFDSNAPQDEYFWWTLENGSRYAFSETADGSTYVYAVRPGENAVSIILRSRRRYGHHR